MKVTHDSSSRRLVSGFFIAIIVERMILKERFILRPSGLALKIQAVIRVKTSSACIERILESPRGQKDFDLYRDDSRT